MATGKYGSASVWFLVDGYNIISAKVKDLTIKVMSKMENTSGLGDAWEAHTPVGRSSVSLSQSGAYFDTTASTGLHAAMSGSVPATPQDAVRVACFGFGGNTIGEPFTGILGTFSGAYEVAAQNEALTKANVDYTVSGRRDNGVILQALAAQTVDWNTEGATSVDTSGLSQKVFVISANTLANPTVITCTQAHGRTTGDAVLIAGSNSTPTIDGERTVTVISTTTFSVPVNVTVPGTAGTFVPITTQDGGAGYQQVTAFSGLTGHIGKFRDSVDDVTYADLGSALTNVTSAPAFQRLEVTGQVDRYLAFDGNVTGAGSITVFAGFARY